MTIVHHTSTNLDNNTIWSVSWYGVVISARGIEDQLELAEASRCMSCFSLCKL